MTDEDFSQLWNFTGLMLTVKYSSLYEPLNDNEKLILLKIALLCRDILGDDAEGLHLCVYDFSEDRSFFIEDSFKEPVKRIFRHDLKNYDLYACSTLREALKDYKGTINND